MGTQGSIDPEVRALLDALLPLLHDELRTDRGTGVLVLVARREVSAAPPEMPRRLEVHFYGALTLDAVCALAARKELGLVARLRAAPPAGEVWCLVLAPRGAEVMSVPRPTRARMESHA